MSQSIETMTFIDFRGSYEELEWHDSGLDRDLLEPNASLQEVNCNENWAQEKLDEL